MKKKERSKFPRNWIAVSGYFRNSAGQMGDEKKEANKNECRNPTLDDEDDVEEVPPKPQGPDNRLIKEGSLPPTVKMFKIVAQRVLQFTMIVESGSEQQARKFAEGIECTSSDWTPDFDFGNCFNVIEVEEIKGE
jgi:hypothetical protein